MDTEASQAQVTARDAVDPAVGAGGAPSEETSRHARTGHRRRRRKRGSRKRRVLRALCFGASCAFTAASVFLALHDSSLRRPETDDGPADPPTLFLTFAIIAGVLAAASMLAALGLKRKRTV